MKKILGLLAAALLASSAFAQGAYPNKPIRLVVPYAPGGVTDVVSRTIAKQMGEHLKQTILVENKTGAGGNIGTEAVAKAAPDGYTVGIGTNGPLAANKSLFTKMPFDAEKDFVPVTLLFTVPYVVFVHPSLGVSDVNGLVNVLKANPGKYSVAHGGVGTAAHFAGQRFVSMAKVEAGQIGYKGESPAVNDVLGGHVPIGVASFGSVMPHLKAGTLRAVAVTSAKRSALLANVPTLDESGLKGYEIEPWFGLVGPAGMPADVVAKLHEAALAALKSPEVMNAVGGIGGATVGNTPAQFTEFIRKEGPRWAQLVKESGVKAE
jgi:tripartite-type tricarboxylate transporter receptor subunit TctC